MVDTMQTVKAFLTFIGGFFMLVILDAVVPALLDTLIGLYESFGGSEVDSAGIAWFIVLITYVMVGIVLPMMLMYKAYTVTNDEMPPMTEIVINVLFMILGIVFTVKLWHWVTTFASMATDGFTLAIFWIGFTMNWALMIIIMPIISILQARERVNN